MRILLFVTILAVACGEDKKPQDPTNIKEVLPELERVQAAFISRAKELQHPDNGWLTERDCDGMLWAAKFASVSSESCSEVDITASEYQGSPGRFSRRPAPYCWTEDGGDQGSNTTWSRDMAVAGLIPYAYRCNRLDILERHRDYGQSNNWQMGEPFADGRATYTPNVLSLLHQTISALGGDGSAHQYWPESYPSGLDDYEAHLQVSQIWLRGEIESRQQGSDAIRAPEAGLALNVSTTMYERLKEHAEREPQAAFYQVAFARYSGAFTKAVNLCLSEDLSSTVGSYVRCHELEQCQLADRLFACSILIEYGRKAN